MKQNTSIVTYLLCLNELSAYKACENLFSFIYIYNELSVDLKLFWLVVCMCLVEKKVGLEIGQLMELKSHENPHMR